MGHLAPVAGNRDALAAFDSFLVSGFLHGRSCHRTHLREEVGGGVSVAPSPLPFNYNPTVGNVNPSGNFFAFSLTPFRLGDSEQTSPNGPDGDLPPVEEGLGEGEGLDPAFRPHEQDARGTVISCERHFILVNVHWESSPYKAG